MTKQSLSRRLELLLYRHYIHTSLNEEQSSSFVQGRFGSRLLRKEDEAVLIEECARLGLLVFQLGDQRYFVSHETICVFVQGRFSGRLLRKEDEAILVEECAQLGVLLGGAKAEGENLEQERCQLSQIVRAIVSGEIRHFLQERVTNSNVRSCCFSMICCCSVAAVL